MIDFSNPYFTGKETEYIRQAVESGKISLKAEVDTFLECGIPRYRGGRAYLAHGFIPLRVIACTHEKLVAFSCKRRGFYPSCGAWPKPVANVSPRCRSV